jgi:pyruvate/2-oxoglutarate dehydrogenase complex dihydrolipoamide dehydrogenase (E3) component
MSGLETPVDADVIIIGSGQAGVPLATKLAARGKRVVVIEAAAPGGSCVNTGCTPTKTMIASARAAHVARTAGRLGVRVPEVVVDFAAVVERKNAIVTRWRQGVDRRLAGEGITLLRGRGRFVGPRTVEVNGQRLRADTIVVNVGARPVVPGLPGLDQVPWLDHAALLELRSLPAHLIVLGGGYIGCEMGQMFRRFGAAVTVVGRKPHLLPEEDEEVSAALEGAFRAEGIDLRLGLAIEGLERGASEGEAVRARLSDGTWLPGSHLLLAVGRRPHTEGLGCETAGIDLDEHGHVVVDDQYRTTAEGVYAVGDAIEGPAFTHVSWDDHRRLLAILEGRPQAGRSGALVPSCVFTDPPVAAVGCNEREARARGLPYEVARLPWGSIARAIETDETAGLVKVLVAPDTERVLGARLVGAEAGELIHVFATLMLLQAPARALVDGQMVHPTLAEGLQSALTTLPRFA